MFAMLDQSPPYHQQAAADRPAHTAQMAPAAPAASSPSVDRATRQEVDSHGYHYIIVGNRLLTTTQLSHAVQMGATPKQAVGEIKQAYERRGYFLVALVGKAQGKQVLLQIVQGRLTHIEGPPHLVAYFARLKDNERIRNSDVIRPSILAQAYDATNGQQPQISFKPAPEVGGSIMHISQTPLADSHAFGGSLTTGNFGNRYAGHFLAQAQAWARHDGITVQLSHTRALTGLDDNTRGAYYAATSATVSAVTPLGTFQLDGGTTKFRLGKAFAPLYPTGKINTWGVSANQLLYADNDLRWSLAEGAHHISDVEKVFAGSFTLHDQKYAVWDVSSDLSWRFGGLLRQPASLSLSAGIKQGTGGAGSGFTRAPGAATAHFRIYTASAGITQALPNRYSVQFNLSGQASNDTLPSYEQWVLGGINNLTAYLPGTIVGDRGYLGRLTLQGPQHTVGPLQWSANAFTEYGASRFSYIPLNAPKWQALNDVGASVSLALPVAHTSLMLAYARPLGSRNVAARLRNGQRSHVFFYLQVAL